MMNRNATRFLVCCALICPACVSSSEVVDSEQPGTGAHEIIKGVKASAPELVLISSHTKNLPDRGCSGSLIAPRIVLTAAHCVKGYDSFDITAPYAKQQTATSKQGRVYDWTVDRAQRMDTSQHDVGLIVLDDPMTLTSWPTLATKSYRDSKAIQYGRILDGVVSMSELYASPTYTLADDGPRYYLGDDTVQHGDSGGPSILEGSSPHLIVAVASGMTDATPRHSVYARVDVISKWIDEVVTANGGWPKGSPPVAPTASTSAPAATTSAPAATTSAPAATSSAPATSCPHDLCQAGAAMPRTCAPCAAEVCRIDDFCCKHEWDASCVRNARLYCKLACK